MPIKVFAVQNDEELRGLTETLRQDARKEFVTSAPVYSKTETEALETTARHIEEVGQYSQTVHMQFPTHPNDFFTMVLSVDTYDGSPRWHLSVSKSGRTGVPERAPGEIVRRIASLALGTYKEGPPEGAFKNVRHFFAPFHLS